VTLVDENDEVLATPVDANVAFSVNVIATDYVQVVSKQGGAGTVVRIPILIYDVTAVAVTGIDLDLLYDETVLTPTTDAGTGNLNAVSATDGVVPAGWTVEQNLPSLGRLAISLAGDFSAPILTGGLLVNVDFTISASATADTTLPTPIQITNLRLNEGGVPATGVDGLFTILGIVYGDATGDGTISAYDGSWVLEYVVNNLTGTIKQFPIEIDPPVWASQPLTAEEAREVADVGNDSLDAQATPDDILASDASLILQRRVGIILLFPVEVAVAPVPVADPVSLAYTLSGSATSERPGARITVSLDTSAIEGLTAGEFALDFDPSLLRLTTVVHEFTAANTPI
jgi:hypothetical protein